MNISDEIRQWCDEADISSGAWLRGIADRIDREMVELPRDADGVPIRIGDVLFSSGNECHVVSITVKADEACVGVHTDEGVFIPSVNPKYLSRKNPDDSFERIADDIEKTKGTMFISEKTLDGWADRIRKLAKEEARDGD